MKVLLIEDDDIKRSQIEAFLSGWAPDLEVRVARSLRSGLTAAASFQPNVVLLDMSMPAFDVSVNEDGFKHLAFAGREFLEHLDTRTNPPSVIVVTSFPRFGIGANTMSLDQLDAQLRANYSEVYCGAVSYSSIGDQWQTRLADVLTRIRGSHV